MDKTWKKIERKVAALINGIRVPITGRTRGSAPDVDHPVFSIEVKHRQQLPSWMFDAVRQAEASRKYASQIPLVILHQKGLPVPMSFVVMRFSDIIILYKRLEELEQQITQQKEGES